MLYSEKHRNSTAGPLVLRGDSSSNSGPSPSTASSFPFLFWLASRGKPLELEIQIPTAVGIQNSAILLVSASPITTAQTKACMSGSSRHKFQSWFLTAICPVWFSARIRLVVSWPPWLHVGGVGPHTPQGFALLPQRLQRLGGTNYVRHFVSDG